MATDSLNSNEIGELLKPLELLGAHREISPLEPGNFAIESLSSGSLREELRIRVETPGAFHKRQIPDSSPSIKKAIRHKPKRIYMSTNPIACANLFDDVLAKLKRYLVLKSEHHYVAETLWILGTHAIEFTDFAPRLGIWSPEKRCGKSLNLEVVGYLSARAIRTGDISPAALFRRIGQDPLPPTVLIDESDSIWGGKGNIEKGEALRQIANSGFKRGQVAIRMGGKGMDEIKEFPVFSPLALAGIGTSAIPETVADRAIMIEMRRKNPDEEIEEFESDEVPEIFDALREEIARMIESRGKELRDIKVEKLSELNARARDKWKPLLRIATLGGEDWLEKARNAAIALDSGEGDLDEMSEKLRLLRDCQVVFKVPQLTSKDLLNRLMEDEESEWRYRQPFNQLIISRMLKQYGIKTRLLGSGHDRGKRGYVLSEFEDAWKRYCPELPLPENPATSATSATSKQFPEPGVGKEYGKDD